MFNIFKKLFSKKENSKFTKLERRFLYEKCLDVVESKKYFPTSFCCWILEDLIEQYHNQHLDMNHYKIHFPELYKLRKRKTSQSWFTNDSERINALKKCIELTK